MEKANLALLKAKCSPASYRTLMAIKNPELHRFIADYVKLADPASVFVRGDSERDAEKIRKKAVAAGEESPLKREGHTFHFDGYFDQGRDKDSTRFLLAKGVDLGPGINSVERAKGLAEIKRLLKNSMAGKEMFVLFLCLGPADSEFSIYAVQLSDSAYVAHSENLLYRGAYRVFKKKGPEIKFFRYVHSAGELENHVSRNHDRRRIYVDFADNIVYSVNTQYAGNTVGLKKLSLRLAIRKADQEKWLAEHMFIMAVHGPRGRKTYFTGAFPSFCGKTSTCMVRGESILGDDIAYLRRRDGKVFAVNVERGIFGIIKGVNAKDDPLIWESLTSPGDVIFSNVLIVDGVPCWQGDKRGVPERGLNYSGNWWRGKKDAEENEIPHSHPNARYTIRLESLKNCDPELDNPDGVEVEGVIYGARDSDTWPPVFASFDWGHGVITIAGSLESETTAATLGQEGIRKFNLMANLDFLSIPIGKYVRNHLDFPAGLRKPPVIFGVNYFLKGKNGTYLTGMHDKRVWLKWMELMVHGELEGIKTPIGLLPRYEDLRRLFREVLETDYPEANYREQFQLRLPENLAKIDRINEIFRTMVKDAPAVLFTVLEEQRRRLEAARAQHGDHVLPSAFGGGA